MKYRIGVAEVGLALVIISLIIGAYYFILGNGAKNIKYKQPVIIRKDSVPTQLPSSVLPTNKATEGQPIIAGACVSLPADPKLKEKYRKLGGTECGYLDPVNFDNEKQLSRIKNCLNNALKSCDQAKAYVLMQGFEGSTEYILYSLKEKNCMIKVERWRTTDSYCGLTEFTCKEVSEDFPSEMCDGK